jgi:hypothetical protein
VVPHRSTIVLACAIACAMAALAGCDSSRASGPIDPLTVPNEVLMWPAVPVNSAGERAVLGDSSAESPNWYWYNPDTMAVLAPGETFRALARPVFYLRAAHTQGVPDDLAWSSDNDRVATVDRDGIVTAHAAGVAIVTAAVPSSDVETSAKVNVLAEPFRFMQLSAGSEACGLTTNGSAYCWGAEPWVSGPPNFRIENVGPHRVIAPEAFTMLSGAEYMRYGFWMEGTTCGLGVSGRVYCWKAYGAYSAYDPEFSSTATPIDAPVAFTTVAVGSDGSCALDGDGNAYCWGYLHGSLADATDPPFGASYPLSDVPSLVPGGLHFKSVAVGQSACGIVVDGTVYCWSTNPKPLPGNVKFSQLDVGPHYACGVTVSNDGYCWGTSADGGLGLGSTTTVSSPTLLPGGLKFASINVGKAFDQTATCGLTLDGVAVCWGENTDGVLGMPGTASVTTPTPIASSLRFSSLASASVHACGIAAGRAYCWGRVFGHRTDSPDVPTVVEGQGAP